MKYFTRTHFIVEGIAVVLMLQAGTAMAQIAPRRNFSGDRLGNRNSGYYSYDPVIFPDINQTNAAYQQAANQQRSLQAQSSMARSSSWQNINQSMMQQANMRTQSMSADRQSAQDWWFETQAQQVAARQARESSRPMNLPPLSSGLLYGPDVTETQKPAAKEIMLWPTLLKSPEFDSYRAKVEAPFRRSSADKKPLTADDYRGILKAIEEMKEKLEGMSSQVVESEFAAVKGYLDEIAADAQKRLDARLEPNRAAEKKEVPENKS